jgi:hypothetical protein
MTTTSRQEWRWPSTTTFKEFSAILWIFFYLRQAVQASITMKFLQRVKLSQIQRGNVPILQTSWSKAHNLGYVAADTDIFPPCIMYPTIYGERRRISAHGPDRIFFKRRNVSGQGLF